MTEGQASSGGQTRASWRVGLTLFFLALIPRLHAIWRGFYTPDEPSWVFRSIHFLQAVESSRWADTMQTGHPGVVTMWLGTLGVLWRRWHDAAGTAAHLDWVGRVPWVTPDNGELFRHLAPFLPPARMAMALMTALGVVGVYVLACRLWGRRQALLGAGLLAFDPFVVGLSGLLHLDAPAMTFVALCLLAWLATLDSVLGRVGRKAPARAAPTALWKSVLLALLSGACAGLAVLSKAPAILCLFVLGISTPLCVLLLGKPSWRRVGRIVLLAAVWLVAGAALLFALFPAMWVDPWGVLTRMFGMSDSYFDAPLHIHFFRGVVTPDPGPLFYPLALLFRLTPISMAGLLLSCVPLLTGWRSPAANRSRAFLASMWALIISFAVVMSVAAQKFDRYLLPVFPALDLLAAAGWMYVVRRVEAVARQPSIAAFTAILIVLVVAQGAMVLPSWPYYLDAYNPLLGGMRAAQRTFTVGWGEGMEQVADWLDRQQATGERIVAARSPVLLAPLVDARVLSLDEAARTLSDWLVITAGDRQIDPEGVAEYTSGAQLAHTVHIGGREAFWVYDVQDTAEEQHLSRYGAPGDLLLCDVPSSFARHSPNWNVELVLDGSESQIAALLNGWSTSHSRLWYLSYPVASPITSSILRRQLDTYAARLDHVDLGYATATLYILPDVPAFTASEDAFVPASFGQMALVGGAVLESPQEADRLIRFGLRWQALATPQADYRPFIHLRDAQGHLRVAGRGEELLLDRRAWSTSYWSAGEGIEADYSFGVPAELPPGRYMISVGLSEAESGGWVPVLDEEGRIRGTTATVLFVDLSPSPTVPDPAALQPLNPTSVDFAGQIRLLGYEHPSRSSVGERVVVELIWMGLEPFAGDDAVRISLVSSGGAIAHAQTFPLSAYPTSRWRPGELIEALYDVWLPAELEGGRYRVSVQVLDEDSVARGTMAQLGSVEVSVQPRQFELPRPPQYPLDLTLGQGIQLLGYDLPQVTVTPGGHVVLTLYWRCQAPVAKSYTVFVHLLDANGQVQGQHDTPPVDGDAPTSGWVVEQVIVDEYAIPVFESAKPGQLVVEVGMYDPRGIVRLPIVDAEGNALPDDRVLLDVGVTVTGD